jgi:hypothetical protein
VLNFFLPLLAVQCALLLSFVLSYFGSCVLVLGASSRCQHTNINGASEQGRTFNEGLARNEQQCENQW